VGFGLDTDDAHQRILTGEHSLVVGGSAETHAEIVETMLRLESELERRGQRLGDLEPAELVELAWRIDSPELMDLALRLKDGLEQRGMTLQESPLDLLAALTMTDVVAASE